jgi:hypothetical protein
MVTQFSLSKKWKVGELGIRPIFAFWKMEGGKIGWSPDSPHLGINITRKYFGGLKN